MTINNISIYNSFDPNQIREMQETNTEILLSSDEYAYWQQKMKEDHECSFYRKFKTRKSNRKVYCEDRSKYKGSSKWYGEIGRYYTYRDHRYNLAGNVSETPTRHLVKCGVNHQSRILFESQKAADNFIKYNAERIKEQNGYAPIRSYYCSLCGGWHVTSQEYKPHLENVMCHTEATLMAIEAFNESAKFRNSNKSQDPLSVSKCSDKESLVYVEFKRHCHEFAMSCAMNDLESMIDLYEIMDYMVSEIDNRDEIKKSLEKLKDCKRNLIKSAMDIDDIELFDGCTVFDYKEYTTIRLFMTVRHLMDRFDHEMTYGNISECQKIYDAVYNVKDINFYGNGKVIKRFLDKATQSIGDIMDLHSRIKHDIDAFITAYNAGDITTCRLIEKSLSACDLTRCDYGTFDIYSSAVNLMHTSLSAAA